MNLTDAQIEELVQRILDDTGLAREKLGVIIDGMVSTYGIREKFARDHSENGDRSYDMWDYYLSGSYEIVMNAGARMQHIEALVFETYWRKQKEQGNGQHE